MTTLSAHEQKIEQQLQAARIKKLKQAYERWQRFVKEEIAKLEAADTTRDDLTLPRTPPTRMGSKLTRAEQRELARIFEQRRQQEGYPPDERGRRMLLDRIANELAANNEDGTPRATGLALVWFGDGLKEINAEKIVGRLDAAAFKQPFLTRKRGILGVVAVLLGLCIGSMVVQTLLSRGTTQAAPQAIAIGAQTAPIAPLLGAQLDAQAVGATLHLAHPPIVCLAAAFNPVTQPEATLVLTRTTAIQTYAVTPHLAQADLLLGDCHQERGWLAARLQESRPVQLLPPSSIQRITVAGPDSDPTQIAAGQMVVEITLTTPALAEGMLTLADGSRWPVAARNGTTVRYVVPRSETAQQAAIEVVSEAAPPQVVVLELPAPTSRLALLHEQVRVTQVQATRSGDQLTVQATLTLVAGRDPLRLLPTDVQLGGAASQHMPLTWTPPTLQAGQPVPITVQLPIGTERTRTLIITGYQVHLTITT